MLEQGFPLQFIVEDTRQLRLNLCDDVRNSPSDALRTECLRLEGHLLLEVASNKHFCFLG